MELLKSTMASVCLLAFLQAGDVASRCPKKWLQFGQSCFRMYYLGNSWYRSQALCSFYGGHLAKIPDAATQHFLAHKVIKDERTNAWIGLNDLYKEGSYTWLDNTETTYTRWARHQPNNYKDQDCVHIWGNTFFKWADDDCNRIAAPLCEKPATS